MIVELQTPRLILRPFRPEDLDEYAEMCADAEVMRYLSPTGEALSREESWRQMAMILGHWQLRGFGMWAAEERSTGRLAWRRELLRRARHGAPVHAELRAGLISPPIRRITRSRA